MYTSKWPLCGLNNASACSWGWTDLDPNAIMVARAWAVFWEHTRFAISSDPSTVLNAPQLTLAGWWTSNAASSQKAFLIPQAWVRHGISELEVPLEIHKWHYFTTEETKARAIVGKAAQDQDSWPNVFLTSVHWNTYIQIVLSCNWKKTQFVMSSKCQLMGIQTCRRNNSRSLWRHDLGKLGGTLEALRGRTISEDPGLALSRGAGKACGRNELISIIASKYTPPILRVRKDDSKYPKSRKKHPSIIIKIFGAAL